MEQVEFDKEKFLDRAYYFGKKDNMGNGKCRTCYGRGYVVRSLLPKQPSNQKFLDFCYCAKENMKIHNIDFWKF